MSRAKVVSALVVASLAMFWVLPAAAQAVAKKATKKAASEATESAVKDAAGDAAKDATKKAMAPDAIDLNAASPDQLKKIGLDAATAKKVVDGRPYSGLDDPKLMAAVPADVLKKLQGKVTVKPPTK